MRNLVVLAAVFCLVGSLVFAAGEIPKRINYQAYIKDNNTPYSGTGYFKFAVVDGNGDFIWTNDGSIAEPANAVTTTVTSGVANIVLGDISITNMNEIPADVFANRADTYLRIWFSQDGASYTVLAENRQFVSVPYAYAVELAPDSGLEVDSANGGVKIQDGGVTVDKIDDDAITADKIDDDAVTAAQISENAVDTSEIAEGAVTAVEIEDGAITTADIGDEEIVNADVSPSAAINPSKIDGTAATLTGDQNFNNGAFFISWATRRIAAGTDNPGPATFNVETNFGIGDNGLRISGDCDEPLGVAVAALSIDDFELDITGFSVPSWFYGAYIKPNIAPTNEHQLSNLCAVYAESNHGGDSHVVNVFGVNALISKEDNDATIGEAYCIKTMVSGEDTGTIDNAYGICIGDNTGSSITNSYGLYQVGEDDNNYFAGNVGIGAETPVCELDINGGDYSSSGRIIDVTGNFSGTNGNFYGLKIEGLAFNPTAISSAALYGAYFRPYTSTGVSCQVGTICGVAAQGRHAGTGQADEVYGVLAEVAKHNNAGVIAEAYGIKSIVASAASGDINAAYGVYIEDIKSSGNVTQSHGLYQAGSDDLNYFAGNVGIGTTAVPGNQLSIDGGEYSAAGSIVSIDGDFTSNTDSFFGLNMADLTYNPSADHAFGNTFYGMYVSPDIPSSCTYEAGNMYGVYSQVSDFGEGSTDILYAIHATAIKDTDIGGTVFHAAGIKTQVTNDGNAGFIANGYGVYVGANSGVITNSYGIYQEGASDENYFAGPVNINNVLHLEPSAEPGSPSEGDIYYDSGCHKLRCFDGTLWQDCW